MAWQRIPIDPDEPGPCLKCLADLGWDRIRVILADTPRERPYPGRCLICREPLGPLRPLDATDGT